MFTLSISLLQSWFILCWTWTGMYVYVCENVTFRGLFNFPKMEMLIDIVSKQLLIDHTFVTLLIDDMDTQY